MKIKLLFLILLVSGLVFSVQAQVTVGMGEEPTKGALLQLKNKEVTGDIANADKGFGLPRVELTSLTELSPMFPATPPVDNGTKLEHTGLTVYNVNVDAAIPLAEGIYTWDGSKWVQVTTEYTNPIKRLEIVIGRELVTETYAYYGTLEYSDSTPEEDDFALVNVVPIVTSGPNAPNFVPDNLFFSTSMRREDTNTVVWKLKIENRNTKDNDPNLFARVEGVYILYTSTGGTFKPVQLVGEPDGVYVTEIPFIGLGTDPNQ
jgi:hypothetical protein